MNPLYGKKGWDWRATKTFLEAHGSVGSGREGRVRRDEAQIDHAQHRSKPKISSLAAVHHLTFVCGRGRGRGTLGAQCGLLVHFEGFTQVGIHPLGQSPPSCDGPISTFSANSRVEGVCKMSLAVTNRCAEQPSDLPPSGIVRFQKWYSCNNRRL